MANKTGKNGKTEREIYQAMIDGTIDGDEMAEFAEKKLAQLDRRNATAKVRAEKKRAENDALLDTVAQYVGEEPKSREDITEAMIADGYEGITVGKVTSRLSKLVKNGVIAKAKAKVSGEDNKTREVTVYALSF